MSASPMPDCPPAAPGNVRSRTRRPSLMTASRSLDSAIVKDFAISHPRVPRGCVPSRARLKQWHATRSNLRLANANVVRRPIIPGTVCGRGGLNAEMNGLPKSEGGGEAWTFVIRPACTQHIRVVADAPGLRRPTASCPVKLQRCVRYPVFEKIPC